MKIVQVGAGSFVFTQTLLSDALVDGVCGDGELWLVDLNRPAAERMAQLGRRIARDLGVPVRIEATDDRRAALPGADAVVLSAAPQGRRRWELDREVLHRHGLPGQVRECGGVGGLSYAMRTISLALGLCEDMRELCPDAVLLNVTNPLPRVVTAATRFGGVRCYGFCNAAQGGPRGHERVAAWLGRSSDELDVVTAGLNHFAWVVSVQDRATGTDLLPALHDRVKREAVGGLPWDAPFEKAWMARMLDRFGAVPATGASHVGEYLPRDPQFPFTEHSPFHGSVAMRESLISRIEAAGRGEYDWRLLLDDHASWEHPVRFAGDLLSGGTRDWSMINLSNGNALPQLPADRIVEVPVHVAKGQIEPSSGLMLPEPLAEICRAVSDVHELVAEGVATANTRTLHRAIEIDPAILPTEREASHDALNALLDAHRDLAWAGGAVEPFVHA